MTRDAYTQELRRLFEDMERTPAVYLEQVRLTAAGRPVWIWGAGESGRRVLNLCRVRALPVDCIVDSNPRLQGGVVRAVPVVMPAALKDSTAKRPYVLICSMQSTAIAAALSDMGFERDVDWADLSTVAQQLPAADRPESATDPAPSVAVRSFSDRADAASDLLSLRAVAKQRPIYACGRDIDEAERLAALAKRVGLSAQPLELSRLETIGQQERPATPNATREHRRSRPFLLVALACGPSGVEAVAALGYRHRTDYLLLEPSSPC